MPVDRACFVDRLADDVDDAAEHARADRHRDRRAGVIDRSWPRTRPSVVVHGDAAHGVLAEMLGDFEHQAVAAVARSRARSGSPADDRRTATSTTAPMTWRTLPAHRRPAWRVWCRRRGSAAAFLARRGSLRCRSGAAALPAPWPAWASSSGSLLSPSLLPFSSFVSHAPPEGRCRLAAAPRAPRRPK